MGAKHYGKEVQVATIWGHLSYHIYSQEEENKAFLCIAHLIILFFSTWHKASKVTILH